MCCIVPQLILNLPSSQTTGCTKTKVPSSVRLTKEGTFFGHPVHQVGITFINSFNLLFITVNSSSSGLGMCNNMNPGQLHWSLGGSVQYSTVFYCTEHYNTLQESTVDYSTIKYIKRHWIHNCTLQYIRIQYNNIHCTVEVRCSAARRLHPPCSETTASTLENSTITAHLNCMDTNE